MFNRRRWWRGASWFFRSPPPSFLPRLRSSLWLLHRMLDFRSWRRRWIRLSGGGRGHIVEGWGMPGGGNLDLVHRRRQTVRSLLWQHRWPSFRVRCRWFYSPSHREAFQSRSFVCRPPSSSTPSMPTRPLPRWTPRPPTRILATTRLILIHYLISVFIFIINIYFICNTFILFYNKILF